MARERERERGDMDKRCNTTKTAKFAVNKWYMMILSKECKNSMKKSKFKRQSHSGRQQQSRMHNQTRPRQLRYIHIIFVPLSFTLRRLPSSQSLQNRQATKATQNQEKCPFDTMTNNCLVIDIYGTQVLSIGTIPKQIAASFSNQTLRSTANAIPDA